MSAIAHPRTPRRGRRGLAAAGLALAALSISAVPAGAASEAPSASSAQQLNIAMQQQEKTNWCWAASGNTIAGWFGRTYSQNDFCDAAFGYAQGTTCPNSQATLANDQRAFRWMGITPGSYVSTTIPYSRVQSEIGAGRPVETRIQWSSGGGHMEVLYGYDTSKSWVYWGDPWPDDYRYNWATYSYYAGNSDFSWTHTLYGIGA